MMFKDYLLASALSLTLAIPASALKYGYNSVSIVRDPPVIAANFPDQNITLHCPAFASNTVIQPGFANGTRPPTDDDTLDHFVRSLAKKNTWMTYRSADFSSEDGRAFPYVLLSGMVGKESLNSSKLKVWIQGGVHGNEPAGDHAVLALLGKMDKEQNWTSNLLSKMDILVLPRYNPDGEFYFQRYLASNLDPNRDHVKLARQQTRDIKTLFNRFEPHIALDMHEFGINPRFGQGQYFATDALFSAAKNLNIHPSIRNLSESLFAPSIGQALTSGGYRWEPYVTNGSAATPGGIHLNEAGTDAKIGRNAMGLAQTITFLFETRGIGLADQHFNRRTASALTMITSTLEIAANNSESVYSTIESGRKDFIETQSHITITDIIPIENRTFQMIWASNGTIVNQAVKFASATHARANLTRPRPEAYLIPKAWHDVAERLRVSGLEVDELMSVYQGNVETLTVTRSEFPDRFYEGTFTNKLEMVAGNRTLELSAGSFLVRTRQKNAGLAFVALEPENIDSFASFNIIPLSKGDEYPIFRVM